MKIRLNIHHLYNHYIRYAFKQKMDVENSIASLRIVKKKEKEKSPDDDLSVSITQWGRGNNGKLQIGNNLYMAG